MGRLNSDSEPPSNHFMKLMNYSPGEVMTTVHVRVATNDRAIIA